MLLAVQDEVLAHRLGLIPLDANPALFEYKTSKLIGCLRLNWAGCVAPWCMLVALLTWYNGCTGEETASEKNTFVLRLKVMCTRQGAQMVNDRGQHQPLCCKACFCLRAVFANCLQLVLSMQPCTKGSESDDL